MAFNIGMMQAPAAPAGGAELVRLARTNPLHYTADGRTGQLDKLGEQSPASFESAMLKAMDGVNASQNKSTDLVRQMLTDPESVDAQDVTIAMAEANLSLNVARTVLNRVVSAWRDVINTR